MGRAGLQESRRRRRREKFRERDRKRERGREQKGSLNLAGERKLGHNNEFGREAIGNLRKEEICEKRRGNHRSEN